MKIDTALALASKRLGNITNIPNKETKILLAYLLKKDISWIFLHEKDELLEVEKFFSLVKRREDGEPIEYITNSVSFYSNDFFISKGALIPRPESELLVDEAIKNIKKLNLKFIKIAEIGVGSGILSIMIAKNIANISIIATDISEDALKVAQQNIKDFKLDDKITLFKTTYLEGIDEEIDVIISNPPYVADDFKIEKPLTYEPKEAIFGGARGDEILREIIKLSKEREVKLLVCEMGYDQKASITTLLKKFGYSNFYFYKDLSGLDRGFVVYG